MTSWTGFHRLSPKDRLERIATWAGLDEDTTHDLRGRLSLQDAAGFAENVVGTFPLPLGFAVHFVIDGRPHVVPMAVEESSVIAAASHGAKLAAAGGGFTTEVMAPVTVAQVEMRGVPDMDEAERTIAAQARTIRARLDDLIPSMVRRGGGMRAIRTRRVDGRLVVHLDVDCRDAMGANTVNTLAEAAAPWLEEATGGTAGLRILTNLADTRLATARALIPFAALGGSRRDAFGQGAADGADATADGRAADEKRGAEVAEGIVAAQAFAEADPYRAATHNKGIMNGVDPVVLATGNDWRAVEAGAHAYAAQGGRYAPLTRYRRTQDGLHAELTLPVPIGTVGGVTRLHPVARACLEVLGDPDAQTLAGIIASVGLAQNLAALRALSQDGIQQGHMRLHARNIAAQAGLEGPTAEEVARQMVQEGTVSVSRAVELADHVRAPDHNR